MKKRPGWPFFALFFSCRVHPSSQCSSLILLYVIPAFETATPAAAS